MWGIVNKATSTIDFKVTIQERELYHIGVRSIGPKRENVKYISYKDLRKWTENCCVVDLSNNPLQLRNK